MRYYQIGRRIRQAREKQGLTQEKLSRLTNISVDHISVIERGIKSPRTDTLVDIANALGVSGDNLLQDVVERSCESTCNELYEKIKDLPVKEQKKIFAVVEMMIRE